MIKIIEKTPEKVKLITDMSTTFANAIRRSVSEIPILAIDEVDIHKNDSALYDEIIALRLGLVPLKNEKLKEGQTVTFKLKAEGTEVVSGGLGDGVVYKDMPIVTLGKDQALEIVARARSGKGIEHAKFSPGLAYYRELPKISISKDAEKYSELAERYPKVFSFEGRLKVNDATECDFDQDDVKDYKGVSIEPTGELVFVIESWGQIDAKDIFLDTVKELNRNLKEVSAAIK